MVQLATEAEVAALQGSVAGTVVPRGGPSLATYLANNAVFNVKDFGGKGDGVTDDTAAFTATITAAAAAGRHVYVPSSATNYIVSAGLVLPTAVGLLGDGSNRSIIQFAPTANGTCVTVSAGVNQAIKNKIIGIGFYSADLTYTKVALRLSDVSSVEVDDLYVFGAGTGTPSAPYWTGGTGSTGLQTAGREAGSVSNLRICADLPISVTANPNTTPTNGEDLDHWHFANCYLVAKGNPCITVATGLGVSHVTFDGYQAWVGGTGGFFLNDTRVAPTVVTRAIKLANVRCEQATSATGYWFDFTATQPIETLTLENCFGDSNCQGIHINGCLQAVIRGCIMARGSGNSLLTAGAVGGSTIDIQGCYWQPGSTFNPAGYTLVLAGAFDAAVTQGPSTAIYANVVAGSLVNMAKLTALCAATTVGLLIQSTSSGDNLVVIPQAAGNGALIRAENSALGDFTPLGIVANGLTLQQRTGVGTASKLVELGASATLGFYGVTPIARALLATGAGHSVDDVITALQNLGFVRQS